MPDTGLPDGWVTDVGLSRTGADSGQEEVRVGRPATGCGGTFADSDGDGLQRGSEHDVDATGELEASQRDDSDGLGVPAWGKYGPAIDRWARQTRPAPHPTDDQGRLSPKFVEWMMGLPDGWVTDVGLSRKQQLRCLGNGVVPQAAAVAWQINQEEALR